jgi:hypothetical protein
MASTATRWPLRDQVQAQRLDEGALADAGHAGDAEAERLAGVRQQFGQQRVGLRAVVGAGGLEQRDRLGDGAALAAADGAALPVFRPPSGSAGPRPLRPQPVAQVERPLSARAR